MYSTIKLFAATSIMLGASFFISTKTIENKERTKEGIRELNEEREGIRGYMQWINDTKANQTTGEINLADVYTAREAMEAESNNANKTAAFDVLRFKERGANNVGGRCKQVIIDINDNNKLYAAAAGGGLWISLNRGNSWTKFEGNDTMRCLSVNSVAQSPNGDIYLGTGEGVPGLGYGITTFSAILIPGEGIFKSTDGGLTFNQLASTKPSNSNSTTDNWAFVNKVACHPTDANIVYAATSRGMKRSTDGGNTWLPMTVPGMSPTSKYVDVEAVSGDELFFCSEKKLFKSTDAGLTSTAMPFTATGNRTECAIAPNDKNTVVMVNVTPPGGLNLLVRTKDGGATWDTLAQGGPSYAFEPFGMYDQSAGAFYGQGDWDIALGISPTDPNMFYIGGQLHLYRFNPSTSSFQSVAYWLNNPSDGDYVHADMHCVTFDKVNPNTMYVCGDGGVYRTLNANDPKPVFAEKNKNLNATQAYGFSVNKLDNMMYGLQDNGSWFVGKELNSPMAGLDIGGGDGGTTMMSDVFTNVVFRSVVMAAFSRTTDGGGTGSSWSGIWDEFITDTDKNGDLDDGGVWVTPCKIIEKENGIATKSVVLIGTGNGVIMSQNASNPGVATPLWFKITLGFDATAVEASPDGKFVYAASSTGAIYKISGLNLFDTVYSYDFPLTTTSPKTWNNAGVVRTLLASTGRFVTSLCAARAGTNPYQLIYTLGNYGNTAYVYKTLDASVATPTFTNITNNLPPMPVFSAQSLATNDNKIVLGTDLGVWGSDNGGATWSELNKMVSDEPNTWHPRVPTVQVITKKNMWGWNGEVIHTCTHGRGMFTSYSLATAWPLSTSNLSKDNALILYPNPSTNKSTVELKTSENGKGLLQVYDVRGNIVFSDNILLKAGSNKYDLNTANYSNGNYILKIFSPSNNYSYKFIKQ